MSPAEVAARWGTRAERLLERALGEVQDEEDAIPAVEAALTALRIEAHELPEDTMDGYPFPDEDGEAQCICPPDLLARGGYRGACPAH